MGCKRISRSHTCHCPTQQYSAKLCVRAGSQSPTALGCVVQGSREEPITSDLQPSETDPHAEPELPQQITLRGYPAQGLSQVTNTGARHPAEHNSV